MRRLLNRLIGPRPETRQPNTGPAYRPAQPPLRPAHIRNQRFTLTRLGQRGLDPAEVHAFLDRVATDLANAYAAADRGQAEATRIKNALRRWQTEQFNQHQQRQRQLNHSYR